MQLHPAYEFRKEFVFSKCNLNRTASINAELKRLRTHDMIAHYQHDQC